MLLVIRVTLDHPVPGLEGLLATSEILLCDEGLLILRDLAQIFASITDCRCNLCEADASIEFAGARSCATLYLFAEVESVTVGVLGCRYAVRTEQHLGAAVLAVLSRF